MLRYCANLKAVRYESTSLNRIVADKSHRVIVALGLHEAICRTHSSEFIPGYCVNFKAMRLESAIFDRIVANKSHSVTLA